MKGILPVDDIARKTSSRPHRSSEIARRRQLVDAAEAIFLEKGYHAATMDDIARQAGMSKKTIYQMVPAKAALFDLLLADRLAPLFVPIEDNGREPRAILRDFLIQIAAIVLSPQQVALLRLLVGETRSPEIGLALRRQGIGQGNGALEDWLDTQVARGVFAMEDRQEASAMLFGATIGEFLIGQLANTRPPPSPAVIARRVEEGVTMFLLRFERQAGA